MATVGAQKTDDVREKPRRKIGHNAVLVTLAGTAPFFGAYTLGTGGPNDGMWGQRTTPVRADVTLLAPRLGYVPVVQVVDNQTVKSVGRHRLFPRRKPALFYSAGLTFAFQVGVKGRSCAPIAHADLQQIRLNRVWNQL